MRWIDPARLLQWCTGLCLIAVAATAVVGGMAGRVGMIAASALLSIVYPTVFGTALGRHRNRIKLAAGLLVAAAGIGNAVSALMVNLSLDVLLINNRVVIFCALPFVAVLLACALATRPAKREVV